MERLEQYISSGKALARHIKHANVLLKLNEGWTQCQIAQAFDLTQRTVVRLKQRCEREGVEAVLVDKPRSGAPKRFSGETAVAMLVRMPQRDIAIGLCECWRPK